MKVNGLGRRALVAAAALAAVTATTAAPSATAGTRTEPAAGAGAAAEGGAGTAASDSIDGWPGSPWEVVQSNEFGTLVHLGAVTAAGPHAAWAAGYHVIDTRIQELLLRWDGRKWRPERAPGLPEVTYWLSVAAVSAQDVWAYGRSGISTYVVAHFDGKRWRTVASPGSDGLGGYEDAFEAVPGRVWLAAEDMIRSYADGRWETLNLGENTNLIDLDARTAGDAWAALRVWDPEAEQEERYRLRVLHWNGGRWRDTSPPDLTGLWPEDVYVESKNSVYLLASPGDIEDSTPHLLHWDGRRWEEIDTPAPDAFFGTMDGDGDGTVWFAGHRGGAEDPPVFWRYDAGSAIWTRVPGEPAPEDGARSYALHDLSSAGPHGGYWAVGSYTVTLSGNLAAQRDLIYFGGR